MKWIKTKESGDMGIPEGKIRKTYYRLEDNSILVEVKWEYWNDVFDPEEGEVVYERWINYAIYVLPEDFDIEADGDGIANYPTAAYSTVYPG